MNFPLRPAPVGGKWRHWHVNRWLTNNKNDVGELPYDFGLGDLPVRWGIDWGKSIGNHGYMDTIYIYIYTYIGFPGYLLNSLEILEFRPGGWPWWMGASLSPYWGGNSMVSMAVGLNYGTLLFTPKFFTAVHGCASPKSVPQFSNYPLHYPDCRHSLVASLLLLHIPICLCQTT